MHFYHYYLMFLVVVLLSQLKYLKVYMLPLSWNIKIIELLHEHLYISEANNFNYINYKDLQNFI